MNIHLDIIMTKFYLKILTLLIQIVFHNYIKGITKMIIQNPQEKFRKDNISSMIILETLFKRNSKKSLKVAVFIITIILTQAKTGNFLVN